MDINDKDVWYREEFRDRLDELASRTEYEALRGLKPKVMNSRFRDYADRVPSRVMDRWRSSLYPEWIYVISELDDFMKSITGHDAPRSKLEVLQAEVARREDSVKRFTKRTNDRKAEWEKADRARQVQVRKLKQAKDQLKLEKPEEDS